MLASLGVAVLATLSPLQPEQVVVGAAGGKHGGGTHEQVVVGAAGGKHHEEGGKHHEAGRSHEGVPRTMVDLFSVPLRPPPRLYVGSFPQLALPSN